MSPIAETMTSKARVRQAIGHRQPDRVAIDFYARDEIVQALLSHWGLKTHEQLLRRLGVDLRGVGPRFVPPALPHCYADPSIAREDGVYRDIWQVGFVLNQTAQGQYMDLADSPLRQVETLEQIERHAWPSPDWWDYSTLADQARKHADCWVWAHSRGIFEISWFIRGFDTFMLDLALRPELAVAVMDRVQGYLMERTRRVLEAGGGLIDMVEYNDDVGGQGGLLISPDMFRRHLKPRMAEFVRLCRSHGAAVRYHSCGGIVPIIPDLIEVGIDVLNPVQSLAAGMDPFALKDRFGERLTFNGGLDTQSLLPTGTVDEVRRETERLIAHMNHRGGFILAPSHVFQCDVPLANILAVYEVARGA